MRHPDLPFEPANTYVLGFAFGCDGNAVLLIEKNRPAWQATKLNGIGGKVEENDWCLAEAMRREFKEETDIDTELGQWTMFAEHVKPGKFNKDPASYKLAVFSTSLMPEQMVQLKQTTDEVPVWQGLYDGSLHDLLDKTYAVDGTLMYIATALNHMGRPFTTMTIEENP